MKTRLYMEIDDDRHAAFKAWAAAERLPMGKLFERIIDNRQAVAEALKPPTTKTPDPTATRPDQTDPVVMSYNPEGDGASGTDGGG